LTHYRFHSPTVSCQPWDALRFRQQLSMGI
jgi:hypothetical protein